MPRLRLRLPEALILAGLLTAPAKGIEVTGRVIEHGSGATLEDARVTLRYLDGPRRGAEGITDEDGRFHLKAGFQGRCRIDVRLPGYANGVLFAPIEGDLSVVLRLIKTGAVTGRVTTQSGTPVPGAAIVLLRRLPGTSMLQPVTTTGGTPTATQTDGQGAYRLFGLAPGSYAVAARAGGPVPAATPPPRFLAITAGEGHMNIDFTMPATSAGSIDGRVEGAPGEGAVLLALLPRDLPATALASALMDGEGGFQFSSDPVGAYALVAAAPSSGSGGYAGFLGPNPVFGRVELEVAAGSTLQTRLELKPGKTASFQLTGRDQTPASACSPNGTLLLTSLEGWGAQADRRARISTSSSLTLHQLAPVRYAAAVTGLQDGCFTSGPVLVDLTGETPLVRQLQVSPGSDLRGKLVASAPCGGGRAVVLLRPNPEEVPGTAFLALLTGASGHFFAGSLQPGRYQFLAVREEDWSGPHWQPDFTTAVEVQLVSGTTSVDMPSPPGKPGACVLTAARVTAENAQQVR
ncbi:MAG: carboxypeptidase-like regulatory domain-containing protein [Acidobacteria bacterium]|nr:carboxypeptidase-like regulatory domain-containing protein [Acidobacteriota bacterium]